MNQEFFKDVTLTEDQGCLCILDETGDTKITWNKKNADEVTSARLIFQELVVKKRWAAFEVSRTGKKIDKKVTMFEPGLGKVILVPPMVEG